MGRWTHGETRGTAPLTLRARKPGYAVMRECLAIQAGAPARSRWQRFWGHDPLHPDARSWFKGAIGEREVAKALESLGPDFTVLHAVPIGKHETDIDHVVIGPTGCSRSTRRTTRARRLGRRADAHGERAADPAHAQCPH
ncbi:nuclease-related domain-containing protein [Curtobacterium flaccumfaciens]|nr:nuclease-related domain-containing protein [Curtobacterium flaccumfaciens]